MHFFVEIIPKEFPGLTNEIIVICTINTMRTEALPGGVPCCRLNFKISRVGIYKCLSFIVGFAVTVTIWPREVVSCRDFILPAVTNFWATSLVGIYPCRASGLPRVAKCHSVCFTFYFPISTCKFSRMLSILFLKELFRRIW